MTTRPKDYEINDAILAQADVEVPASGYDTKDYYIVATTEDGQPANPLDILNIPGGDNTTVDGTQGGMSLSPRADGYTVGYLTGDGVPPNGLPCGVGTQFPVGATAGSFYLRTDYFPNRLFRYDGRIWVKIEDNVRTDLDLANPGALTQRASFVNNTYTVPTTDIGNIPSRQSLSKILEINPNYNIHFLDGHERNDVLWATVK